MMIPPINARCSFKLLMMEPISRGSIASRTTTEIMYKYESGTKRQSNIVRASTLSAGIGKAARKAPASNPVPSHCSFGCISAYIKIAIAPMTICNATPAAAILGRFFNMMAIYRTFVAVPWRIYFIAPLADVRAKHIIEMTRARMTVMNSMKTTLPRQEMSGSTEE